MAHNHNLLWTATMIRIQPLLKMGFKHTTTNLFNQLIRDSLIKKRTSIKEMWIICISLTKSFFLKSSKLKKWVNSRELKELMMVLESSNKLKKFLQVDIRDSFRHRALIWDNLNKWVHREDHHIERVQLQRREHIILSLMVSNSITQVKVIQELCSLSKWMAITQV